MRSRSECSAMPKKYAACRVVIKYESARDSARSNAGSDIISPYYEDMHNVHQKKINQHLELQINVSNWIGEV